MFKIPFKYLLQKILGFENYLYLFSLFSIYRLQFTDYDKEFLHFLSMIPEDGHVLDLGSNIGTMSVMLAKRVTLGKVYAFEPIPLHISTLKKIIDKFHTKNIEIFETALGEKTGTISMVTPIFYKVKFQGFSHVVENETDLKKGEVIQVNMQKLDDIPEIHNLPKIDAIKIDVENFEYPVLKGAEQLLRHHKPIIYCELWENEKRMQTIQYLRSELDYRVMIFKKNNLIEYTNQRVTNFFFVPR